MDVTPEHQALVRAVEKAGSQSALARALGLKQQHIWNWLNKTGRAKAEYVVAIEKAVDGAVMRHELRPDLYPPEDRTNG